jgi:hypothetical protein
MGFGGSKNGPFQGQQWDIRRWSEAVNFTQVNLGVRDSNALEEQNFYYTV